MYLTPSSSTLSLGSTINVNIYEDSGSQDVNAAKADITYNPNVFQYNSVTSSSGFSINAATSGGGGSVSIDRGAIPAVTGAQLIATVSFTAKGYGTTNISFSGTSKVLANSGSQANQNILTSTTGGSYTVPAPPPPPPPPPPAPTPSPSPSPSPSPTPTPSPAPSSRPNPSPAPKPQPTPSPSPTPPPARDTSAPDISNIGVSNIGTSSALVSWTTSEPATSEIDFGITTKYELTSGNNIFVTDHKLNLNYKLLNPDTTFHYRIKSVDASGNVSTTPDQTFSTKAGSSVLVVKVVDEKNNPVEGAKVSIDKETSKTNQTGSATLSGLGLGNNSVVVAYKGKKTTKQVNIDTPDGVPQNVTIAIQKPANYVPYILIPLIAVLVLAAGAYFLGSLGGGKSGPIGVGMSDPVSDSIVNGGTGSTITPGGSVAPPAPTPPPKPSTKISKASSASSGKIVPLDGNEAAPPTIVRPTIPPRS
jgi:hypothetical protein